MNTSTESVNNQTAIAWLKGKDSNFATLQDEEHIAIMHFTLIWSFFEKQVLSTNASSAKICFTAHQWANDSRLQFGKFESSLEYFRNRYFENNSFTSNFDGLKLRNNDCIPLVKNVINRSNRNPADSVSALLIIVYRLRNNLFHGTKMGNGIKDQADNFRYATQALIAAYETHDTRINNQ